MFYTAAGLLALFLWASTIAFSRTVIEEMGTINAAFFINFFSGLFGFTVLFARFRKEVFVKIKTFDYSYTYKAGIYFILYIVLFNLAIGLSETRTDVLIVGIINYLWPGFIFLFSIPVLKTGARFSILVPGILVAFVGTLIAIAAGNNINYSEILSLSPFKFVVYLMAFIAALLWGIYSNMTKKYILKEDIIAVPLFFMIISVIFLLILLFSSKLPNLSLTDKHLYLQLAYIVIFPSATAYILWDIAMKRGNKKLINAASFSVPLISTIINSIVLNVPLSINFWFACVFVITGAMLCWKSVVE